MSSQKTSLSALVIGAIGVVYGDIGTSVLYAMKEIFGSGLIPFQLMQPFPVKTKVFHCIHGAFDESINQVILDNQALSIANLNEP